MRPIIISCLIMVVCTCTSAHALYSDIESCAVVPGDVNEDDGLNVMDVVSLVNHILNPGTASPGSFFDQDSVCELCHEDTLASVGPVCEAACCGPDAQWEDGACVGVAPLVAVDVCGPGTSMEGQHCVPDPCAYETWLLKATVASLGQSGSLTMMALLGLSISLTWCRASTAAR